MSQDATQDDPETDGTQGIIDPLIANEGGQDETPLQDLAANLNRLAELIQPVLEKLFNAAETDADLWLKKKEVKILTDWQILQARQVAAMQQLMEQQPQRKLWQPGI